MARAMKDSGIAWIGEIPEEWNIVKNKYLLDRMYSGGTPTASDERFYSDVGTPFVSIADMSSTDYVFSTKKCVSVDGIKDKRLEILPKGTILYSIYATIGAVSELAIDATINQAILALILKPGFEKRYYKYCLSAMRDYIYFNANGNTQFNLNADKVWNFVFVRPPYAIQKDISNRLDDECACIDAVIEQTRASIEEYKKLKQAVITQAVTKGIRPNRPMKDSGIDWIGEVPCDWQVTKLKYFATIRSGITLGKVYPAGTKLIEYPYLRVANVQGSYTDLRDVATIAVTEEEAEKYRLHEGELLMTEGGDRDKLGRGTVWHAEIDPCLHQNYVFALQTNKNLLAEYVSYLSDSTVGRDYFDVTANQSVHLASTNSTTILNFTIPYPTLDEQREIVAFLNQKTVEIDNISKKKQVLLAGLESYKKSQIFEYVTGKKESL